MEWKGGWSVDWPMINTNKLNWKGTFSFSKLTSTVCDSEWCQLLLSYFSLFFQLLPHFITPILPVPVCHLACLPPRGRRGSLTLGAEREAWALPRQDFEGLLAALPVQLGEGRYTLHLQQPHRHHAGLQPEVQTLVTCLEPRSLVDQHLVEVLPLRVNLHHTWASDAWLH